MKLCIVAAALLMFAAGGWSQSVTDLPLSTISLPPGFRISLYTTDNVTNARSLAVSTNSTGSGSAIVYASSNGAGVVSAIVNTTGVPRACTLVSGLNNPEGLIYVNGSLYVGQVTNVTRYDNVDAAALKNCTGLGAPVLIATPFPATSDHNSRHIELGPDNKLYISFGSPANLDYCETYGSINACSIVRMNIDGTELENYVVGVRNSVGMTWHPDTQQFFFNMIERDLMGDDRPDDVLFKGGPQGTNYSWPYCHREGYGDPYNRELGPGGALADTDLYNQAEVQILQENLASPNATLNAYCNGTSIAPVQALGPHVAALGLKFYTGSMFPSYYNRTLFVPEHGSWNRPLEIGYRLANVKLDDNYNAINLTVFASGWLQNQNTTAQSVWGRPVATAQLPDGSLLLSDDSTNAVYRITYAAPSPSPAPAAGSVSTTG